MRQRARALGAAARRGNDASANLSTGTGVSCGPNFVRRRSIVATRIESVRREGWLVVVDRLLSTFGLCRSDDLDGGSEEARGVCLWPGRRARVLLAPRGDPRRARARRRPRGAAPRGRGPTRATRRIVARPIRPRAQASRRAAAALPGRASRRPSKTCGPASPCLATPRDSPVDLRGAPGRKSLKHGRTPSARRISRVAAAPKAVVRAVDRSRRRDAGPEARR